MDEGMDYSGGHLGNWSKIDKIGISRTKSGNGGRKAKSELATLLPCGHLKALIEEINLRRLC